MKHTRILSAFAALLLAVPAGACAGTEKLPMDFSGGTPPQRSYEIGLMEYDDPSIHVEHYSEKSSEFSCTYYVVDIKIASAAQ